MKNIADLLLPLIILELFFGSGCRQPYFPPIKKTNLGYLVVDGIIISGDSTIINLSRTQNLTDSTYNTILPETGAVVSLAGLGGDFYALTEQSSGRYVLAPTTLRTDEFYRLKITTTSGGVYQSDSISIKIAPPIDSITWQSQSEGLDIFVNTHDSLGATRYYRWLYTETWEYHAGYFSTLLYDPQDTTVVSRDSSQYTYTCWQADQSTSLLIGTTSKLSQNRIYQQILMIPSASEKLGVEYSLLLKQYAIDSAAYQFWQVLQQSTEQLGSLFDAQPTQLPGNIHCTSNPAEPVIGYLTASTLQEQRIFLMNPVNWGYSALYGCNIVKVTNLKDSLARYYGVGYLPVSPIYKQGTLTVIAYNSAIAPCVDCSLDGGTLVKPNFWP